MGQSWSLEERKDPQMVRCDNLVSDSVNNGFAPNRMITLPNFRYRLITLEPKRMIKQIRRTSRSVLTIHFWLQLRHSPHTPFSHFMTTHDDSMSFVSRVNSLDGASDPDEPGKTGKSEPIALSDIQSHLHWPSSFRGPFRGFPSTHENGKAMILLLAVSPSPSKTYILRINQPSQTPLSLTH